MKLKWDQVGERLYETGVEQGVLYPQAEDGTYPKGVAWNGIISVTESPSGAESNPIYADNIKYLDLQSAEEFGATIEAYMYPDEFGACNGEVEIEEGVTISQQDRTPFGFSYKTILGNDVKKNTYGYKLHLVYCALAATSEKGYSTVNDSPDSMTLSWEVSTTPVPVTGHKPTAHLEIDSTKTSAEKMAAIEAALYGTETEEARLPLPDEIIKILKGVTEEVDPDAAG